MKYLEELSYGDSFYYNEELFILTCDFKNKYKLCYNLATGQPKWILDDTIVDLSTIYTINSENNIVAIKPTQKNV